MKDKYAGRGISSAPKNRLSRDNITPTLKTITLLDGYRINKFLNPNKISKFVFSGKAGVKVKKSWDSIYKVLWNLTSLTSKIPKALSALSYYNFFNTGIVVIFSISILLFIATFFLNIPWVIGGGLIASLLAAVMLLRNYFSKKITESIDEYAKKHVQEFADYRLFLKNFVQELIYDLRGLFKQMRIKPEEHLFNLYNSDYAAIEIISQPNWRRKTMVAAVKIS